MTAGTIDVFPLPRGMLSDGTGTVGGWWISSYFGGRPNPFTGVPSWHGGMDLVAPKLTPMHAVKAGRILQSWDPSGGGNWTRLECDDGDVFGYGHADHFAPGVNGRHVQAGDVVAFVDSTGASTGHHLHFAYQPAGWARYGDPFDLLANCRRFAGDPPAVTVTPPSNPTPAEPLYPEPTPQEILTMHRYWDLDGTFYAVGVEPFLSPEAVGADGQPQSAQHFVGGMYAYKFPGPDQFVLAVGSATQPEKLDRSNPAHQGLIAALEGLALVYQAA